MPEEAEEEEQELHKSVSEAVTPTAPSDMIRAHIQQAEPAALPGSVEANEAIQTSPQPQKQGASSAPAKRHA